MGIEKKFGGDITVQTAELIKELKESGGTPSDYVEAAMYTNIDSSETPTNFSYCVFEVKTDIFDEEEELSIDDLGDFFTSGDVKVYVVDFDEEDKAFLDPMEITYDEENKIIEFTPSNPANQKSIGASDFGDNKWINFIGSRDGELYSMISLSAPTGE